MWLIIVLGIYYLLNCWRIGSRTCWRIDWRFGCFNLLFIELVEGGLENLLEIWWSWVGLGRVGLGWVGWPTQPYPTQPTQPNPFFFKKINNFVFKMRILLCAIYA